MIDLSGLARDRVEWVLVRGVGWEKIEVGSLEKVDEFGRVYWRPNHAPGPDEYHHGGGVWVDSGEIVGVRLTSQVNSGP